ncbi:MAG: hypothetical protein QOG20_5208 [Pseudonocardiales bacterium]|nr:hypothetical protein [Pseudonocardiales bacterium]
MARLISVLDLSSTSCSTRSWSAFAFWNAACRFCPIHDERREGDRLQLDDEGHYGQHHDQLGRPGVSSSDAAEAGPGR